MIAEGIPERILELHKMHEVREGGREGGREGLRAFQSVFLELHKRHEVRKGGREGGKELMARAQFLIT